MLFGFFRFLNFLRFSSQKKNKNGQNEQKSIDRVTFINEDFEFMLKLQFSIKGSILIFYDNISKIQNSIINF